MLKTIERKTLANNNKQNVFFYDQKLVKLNKMKLFQKGQIFHGESPFFCFAKIGPKLGTIGS